MRSKGLRWFGYHSIGQTLARATFQQLASVAGVGARAGVCLFVWLDRTVVECERALVQTLAASYDLAPIHPLVEYCPAAFK